MTTPSPADLARRARPQPAAPTTAPRSKPTAARHVRSAQLTPAAQAIAPGRLLDGERFKTLYQRGLLLSGLPSHARLVGHTLSLYAHHRTGRVSPNHQPSFEQLAADTGLEAARIGVQVEILRQRGWLLLTRINQGPRAGRTRFDLAIPALYLERIRAPRRTNRASPTRTV
ncbi:MULTISPECIES: hypothetical protein [Streptomyces]